MLEVSVFAFRDYVSFIRRRIASEESNWGLVTKLSKAAGCQRPYLSKVLAGEAHLSASQAYGIARFWRLTEGETEYFIGLLEMARAGSKEYREFLSRKNQDLKTRNEELSKVVERPTALPTEKDLFYYSSWQMSAIHILASIPTFQTSTAIASRLGLPESQVKQSLAQLQAFGFVEHANGKWKFRALEQHIPKSSPLSVFHHSNWRQKAVMDSQDPAGSGVHYTVVQSLSVKDFERLRESTLRHIREFQAVAGPSKEEELVCFTCDYFRV